MRMTPFRRFRKPSSLMVLPLVVASTLIGCGPSGRDLSDTQWLDMQQSLQQERAEVGRQRDQLESDRREWDARERQHTMLAAVVSSAALLLACSLPLILIGILLSPRNAPPDQESMCDVLLDQVALQANTSEDEPKRLSDSAPTEKLAHRRQ